jgi:hypothetical protein
MFILKNIIKIFDKEKFKVYILLWLVTHVRKNN